MNEIRVGGPEGVDGWGGGVYVPLLKYRQHLAFKTGRSTPHIVLTTSL